MYFPLIDVLRAYAALSVVLLHVIALFEWNTSPQSGPLSWFHVGGIGVDLFFVISGFVISLSAFSRIDKEPHGFRLSFFIQRLSRIAPLHYLTCAAFIIFISPQYLFDGTLLPDALLHLLFVHNLSEQYQGAINGVNWSVGVEMQFYLLMIMLAPLLRSARPVVIAVVMIGIAWGWRYYFVAHTDVTGPPGSYPRFWIITQLPGMLDEFAVGILLARFVRSEQGRRVVAFCAEKPWIPLFITLAIATPTLMFIEDFLQFSWARGAMSVVGRTPLSLVWAWLIFVACCLQGWLVLLLSAPVRYLGTISYGIYLWHLPVIMSLHLRLPWLNGERALPYVLFISCSMACASWHCFEKPFVERAKEFLKARRTGKASEVTSAAPSSL